MPSPTLFTLLLQLTPTTAPPASEFPATAAPPATENPAPTPAPAPIPPPVPVAAPIPPPTAPAAAPIPPPAAAPSDAPVPPAPTAHLALAAFTEAAIGFADDGFYNQLTGLRLDYRPAPRFSLGVAASYANLKGKSGRAHNVLPAAMLEWRFPLSTEVSLPLRFFTGYLPRNGPWIKASLGLSHRIGQRSRIGFELLAPALWVVHDSVSHSLDAAIEYAVDL
ncbi:MAG: hypothetical protein QM756_26630 [Polyangiaceae bacterium]